MGPQAHFENRLEMWFFQDSRRVEDWSVQHDRHWAVVDEANGHSRPENALLHVSTRIGEGCAERLVEWLRFLGRCGERKARPIALACICDQRELADDERGAAHVEEASIEPAVAVVEDPEPCDFAREANGVLLAVAALDAEQDDQSEADLPHQRALDADPRLRDALADNPHAAVIIADFSPAGTLLEVHARASPPGWGVCHPPPTAIDAIGEVRTAG